MAGLVMRSLGVTICFVACVALSSGSLRAQETWSFRDCIDCPELVVLPPGQFTMGSDDERETFGPAQSVSIQSVFAISRAEITFREYQVCVAASVCRGEISDHGWGRGDRPVINVSWYDAQSYVRWLSEKTQHHYRLPTEVEWEYAARAGSETRYPWGQDVESGRANCRGCDTPWSGRQSAPIGQFEPNAFGLLDMNGNVSEWVSNCWRERLDLLEDSGSTGSDCAARVTRGGDWYYVAALSSSAARKPNAPNLNSYTIGFRVVREMNP